MTPLAAGETTNVRERSVLEQALGEQFKLLHAKIREQYAVTPDDDHYWRGEGVMHVVRHHGMHVVPFLWLGSRRRILFTQCGRDVPFVVENHAYIDGRGRSTVTWLREFGFEHPRRFDEYLVYSPERRCAIVLAGTRQHLAVDLDLSVGQRGELHVRTRGQRVRAWGMRFGFPRLFSGDADVTERYNDVLDRFEIEVTLRNSLVGVFFEYRGYFSLRRCTRDTPGMSWVRPQFENPDE